MEIEIDYLVVVEYIVRKQPYNVCSIRGYHIDRVELCGVENSPVCERFDNVDNGYAVNVKHGSTIGNLS